MYPCWDDIFDKASYTFHITVDDDLYAVAGGELTGIDYDAGKATFHWNHPEPISTYIAALAVSDYIVLTDPSCPWINYYVWSGWEDNAWGSFVNVPEMMDCYEQYFGPYPWNTKFSNVIMDYAGFEHNTNVFLSAFFVNGTISYEFVFAHELAHHWWGNLVTEADWPEIWLAEGFATYSEALWQEYKYGDDAYTDCILEIMEGYLNSGELFPIVPATEFWTWTVYNKGGSVLHMLRHVVDDGDFFDALNLYLTEHAYSSTTTEDLIAAIESTTGSDIDWFFDTWVYDWGYPAYDINWSAQQVGDDWDVTIEVEQVQSVGPMFTMPLDFLISDGSTEDTLVVMWNDLQFDTEMFTVSFEPTSVEFDPYNWVLHAGLVGIETEPANLGDRNLFLYPNPTVSSVEVLWDAAPDDTYCVSVFDMSGHLQIRIELAPDNRIMNISELPSGTYLVSVERETMKETASLVIR
jgi:aminopeptidase N